MDQIQWMLQTFHIPAMRAEEDEFWGHVVMAVFNRTRTTPQQCTSRPDVVLTGHSLGGGLAQVAAARLRLPALVCSAPGMLYSAKRFGVYAEVATEEPMLPDDELLSNNDSTLEKLWNDAKRIDGMYNSPLWGAISPTDALETHTGMQASTRGITVVVPDNDQVPRVDRQKATVQEIACHNSDGSAGGVAYCHSIMQSSCEIWRVCGDPRHRRIDCSPGPIKGGLYSPDDNTIT